MEGFLLLSSQAIVAQPFVGQESTNDLERRMQPPDNRYSIRAQATGTRKDRGARLEKTSMSTSGRDLQGSEQLGHSRTKQKERERAESIR
jgi:hypothetical protein